MELGWGNIGIEIGKTEEDHLEGMPVRFDGGAGCCNSASSTHNNNNNSQDQDQNEDTDLVLNLDNKDDQNGIDIDEEEIEDDGHGHFDHDVDIDDGDEEEEDGGHLLCNDGHIEENMKHTTTSTNILCLSQSSHPSSSPQSSTSSVPGVSPLLRRLAGVIKPVKPLLTGPPLLANSKLLGVTRSLLYNGSRFAGHQKSKGNCYDVEVVLQNVDEANSYLCGYLKIKGNN